MKKRGVEGERERERERERIVLFIYKRNDGCLGDLVYNVGLISWSVTIH